MCRLTELTHPERPAILKELGNETSAAMCTVKPRPCAHYCQVTEPCNPAKVTEDHYVAVGGIDGQGPPFVLTITPGLQSARCRRVTVAGGHLDRPLGLVVLVVVCEEDVRGTPGC